MNWRIEKKVKAGGKWTGFGREDAEVAFDEETETGHIPQKQLDAGVKAAIAAAEGIAGDKLVTIEGHEDAGDSPNAQHLIVTVSRDLS
jgi:hypothetical protein